MKLLLAFLLAFVIAGVSGGIAHLVYTPREPIPQHPQPVLHLIAEANVERGRRLAKACETCHTFEKGKVSFLEGPNLWDIVGSPKASVEEFEYSENLEQLGGEWTYSGLNKYLWNPKYLVPEGSMAYIGVRKAQDRADIIAWMRTLSEHPIALPSEEQIATEIQDLSEAPDNKSAAISD